LYPYLKNKPLSFVEFYKQHSQPPTFFLYIEAYWLLVYYQYDATFLTHDGVPRAGPVDYEGSCFVGAKSILLLSLEYDDVLIPGMDMFRDSCTWLILQ